MRPITDATSGDIALVKPSRRGGTYELVVGSDVVGRLSVSGWSGGSVGEAADGQSRNSWARGGEVGFGGRTYRLAATPHASLLALLGVHLVLLAARESSTAGGAAATAAVAAG
jgi:hypothetical protein